jgi:hypothetical protein
MSSKWHEVSNRQYATLYAFNLTRGFLKGASESRTSISIEEVLDYMGKAQKEFEKEFDEKFPECK